MLLRTVFAVLLSVVFSFGHCICACAASVHASVHEDHTCLHLDRNHHGHRGQIDHYDDHDDHNDHNHVNDDIEHLDEPGTVKVEVCDDPSQDWARVSTSQISPIDFVGVVLPVSLLPGLKHQTTVWTVGALRPPDAPPETLLSLNIQLRI